MAQKVPLVESRVAAPTHGERQRPPPVERQRPPTDEELADDPDDYSDESYTWCEGSEEEEEEVDEVAGEVASNHL